MAEDDIICDAKTGWCVNKEAWGLFGPYHLSVSHYGTDRVEEGEDFGIGGWIIFL